MNLLEFQKGNEVAVALNNKRQLAQGAIEENKRIFTSLCAQYKEQYGIDVTEENLDSLCQAELDSITAQLAEQSKMIDYVKSGAYMTDAGKASAEVSMENAGGKVEKVEKAVSARVTAELDNSTPVTSNVTETDLRSATYVGGNLTPTGVAVDATVGGLGIADYLNSDAPMGTNTAFGQPLTPMQPSGNTGAGVGLGGIGGLGGGISSGIGSGVTRTPNFGDDDDVNFSGNIVKAVESRVPNFGDDEPRHVDIPVEELTKPLTSGESKSLGLPDGWQPKSGATPVQNASPFASIMQNKFGGNQ